MYLRGFGKKKASTPWSEVLTISPICKIQNRNLVRAGYRIAPNLVCTQVIAPKTAIAMPMFIKKWPWLTT